jgi:hypothetical protein
MVKRLTNNHNLLKYSTLNKGLVLTFCYTSKLANF